MKRYIFEKELENGDFAVLRVEHYEGQLWFCARDICNLLGIARVGKILAKLEGGVRTVGVEDDNGRIRDMAFIDIYALNHLLFKKDCEISRAVRYWFYSTIYPNFNLFAVDDLHSV